MKRQKGPWGEVQHALSKRDRDAEIEALLKSGLIEAPSAVKDLTVTPTDELADKPEFLDKVFPKGKKKK